MRELAIDSYRRALRERPDHPTSYRLLALAVLRNDRADEALDVILQGTRYGNRQEGVHEALGAEALLIAAHLAAGDPARRTELTNRMGRSPPSHPSMRVVLTWESDASDLDLEVVDRYGNRASWFTGMASGGEVQANISNGYGPEVFAVDHASGFPYQVRVRAARMGPIGLGAGTVQIIRHDGAGTVTVEDRPFVIQQDGATVELGKIERQGVALPVSIASGQSSSK